MSFDLPDNYSLVEDKFRIMNGQGFINTENYLSTEGRVISLFEVHRNAGEFLKYYTSLTQKYNAKLDKVELAKNFTLKVGEFMIPIYVLKGSEGGVYFVQVFVNCGDAVACFMVDVANFDGTIKTLVEGNPVMKDVVSILRTIQ